MSAITRQTIEDEVYRTIDETSSNSYFTTTDICQFANRELEHLAANFPIRMASFQITGDGVTLDWLIPEPIHKIIALEEGQTFTPPRTFVDIIGAGGLRTTLTRDLFTSYGFSFRPPQTIRIEKTLSTGENRTLWALAGVGRLNPTAISDSSVTVTKGSKVITLADDASIASAAHLDAITVTAASGTKYGVVDSVDSAANTVTMTEEWDLTTDAAASITIGSEVGLWESWLDVIVFGVCRRLAQKESNFQVAEYWANQYAMEKRRKRAEYERVARADSERFFSF